MGAIGLDVGGTKIAGGIVTFPSGQVVTRQVIPTRPERGGPAVLSDALELADRLLAEACKREVAVVGIGVGVAELVDRHGNVTSAHTIAWSNLPVQAAFSELAPALVESDARAPALAEALFGAGRPYRLFTYVTVGTGISYSLVQDQRPYAGAHGNALILANTPLTATCPACGHVSQPTLEETASGPALVTHYNQARVKAGFEAGAKHGQEVIAAVAAGDAIAIKVVEMAATALGTSVGFLINVLDPEAVIVGGGLGLAGGQYWDKFIASTRAHVYGDLARNLPIVPAELGVEAGFIGAAVAAFQRYGQGRER
jgi:glucokinase